jgi:hypothetical protein
VSNGSALGTTGDGGVNTGCIGSADVTGAGGANDTSAGWEWHYPSIGCARPGGARR